VLRYHEIVYDGIVVPGVTTTTGIQHSGDGIHWTQKNPVPEIDAPRVKEATWRSP
jgi:hypothetical protein